MGESGERAAQVAAEILAEEAWFGGLPLGARDSLGDHNFAVAQYSRAVRLARAVQREAPAAIDADLARSALTAARDFITGHPAVRGEWPLLVGLIDKALSPEHSRSSAQGGSDGE